MNANAVSVKQKKILKKWLRHCANLEKEYPLVAGACADYGIDELKNVTGELKFEHAEIKSGAQALISLCEKHLMPSYKEKVRQGKEESMALALETFRKADALDRNGRRDAMTRTLFYNAWEFLSVATSGVEVDESVKEKERYAMWRAAEISKALKENREPLPPSQSVEEEESLLRELELGLGGPVVQDEYHPDDEWCGARVNGDNKEERANTYITTTSTAAKNTATSENVLDKKGHVDFDGGEREDSSDIQLVGIRDYFSGQDVIYCEDASGYRTMRAVVSAVVPGGRSGQHMYDIMTEDGRRLQVSSELLAPDVTCGEELILDGTGEVVVEEIYGSQWPPKYLVKTNSGFVQASDEYLSYCPKQGSSKIDEESSDGGEERNGEKENEWEDGPSVKNGVPSPRATAGKEGEESIDMPHVPVAGKELPQKPAYSDGTVGVDDSDVSWQRQDPWWDSGQEIASAPEVSDAPAQRIEEIDGSPENNRFDGEMCDYVDSYPLTGGIFVARGNTGHGRIVEDQKAPETTENTYTKKVQVTTYSTDVRDMVEAEKFIKNASSALQFNDVSTAVKYLYEALNVLEIQKE